jgi:hypothetical protein
MSITAPVTKDGFAFANGDLFAEASGCNLHRRANPAELKAHFTSGSDKDHPAHWFEAQLIHYGLPTSKTKSVARMRLFDAVNGGKLVVPAYITKLEAELKKEWVKKDREVKKASKAVGASDVKKTTTEKKAGVKRKADDNVDIVVNVGGINVTVSASNSASQSASKKAKSTTTKPAANSKAAKAVPKPKETKASPKPKAVSKAKIKSEPSAATSSQSTSATPKKPSVARRGGISQGPSRSTTVSSSAKPSRPMQTARRSNAFMARGRLPAPVQNYGDYDDDSSDDKQRYDNDDRHDNDDGYDRPPPAYSEYQDDDDDDQPLGPLGLLNGRYEIDSPYVTGNWNHYDEDDFSLILTLAGQSLWGSFDLGIYEGVLRFDVRPYQSSHDRVHFQWRGREDQGPVIYGNDNSGWIKFLGDGRIEGYLDRQGIEFHGRRIPGQPTRSEVDSRTLQSEWNGYSEEEYERENRARWR